VWVATSVAPLQPEPPSRSEPNLGTRKIDQTLVAAAIQEWRMTPSGQGNDSFFMRKMKLGDAGMDAGQIASTLESEASFGHSPNERRSQIPSIMDSLKKGWTRFAEAACRRGNHRCLSFTKNNIFVHQ